MKTQKAPLLLLAMASAIAPALAQSPSPASCLVGGDKVALAAGVRADSVKDTPGCHLTWQEAGVMVGFPPPLDKRVTPDNVFRYPFVRWTLQNTSLFTRTVSMLAERPATRPIPEALDTALLNTELTIRGARQMIADYAAVSFTDALVVIERRQARRRLVWRRHERRQAALHLVCDEGRDRVPGGVADR